jgi:hypothetical protein
MQIQSGQTVHFKVLQNIAIIRQGQSNNVHMSDCFSHNFSLLGFEWDLSDLTSRINDQGILRAINKSQLHIFTNSSPILENIQVS